MEILAIKGTSYNNDLSEKKPRRDLNIEISQDRLEAYITIIYHNITVKYEEEKEKLEPPLYKLEEIKSELLKAGIVYGIIDENLKQCTSSNGVHRLLIARGDKVINGEDDKIIINFEVDSTIKKLKEDKKGNVDFKSIGAIKSVKKDEVIAYRCAGKYGTDGKDVKGNNIKAKEPKRITLKAGKGCMVVDDKIVAAIEGKPCMKNNNFYVFSVHEVLGDVDLTTGNIIFSGDVLIHGNVNEGMEVHSGNSITINKSVERGKVTAQGDVTVEGNVIGAKITSGGQDSEKLKTIESISNLNIYIKELITAVEEIKNLNYNLNNASDGQIIKFLLESKFSRIIRLCISVLGSLSRSEEQEDMMIIELIKNKLMGLAPISIKHYSELFPICECLDIKITSLKETLSIPVNVKLQYVQDSTVSSSGDIFISGRGAYLSSLYAYGSIFFTQDMSVVIGGALKAHGDINCKTVGSNAGAHTKLVVGESGHIYMDVAYENTAITVGKREFLINYDSKNVHAYLNKAGELNIDRFKL